MARRGKGRRKITGLSSLPVDRDAPRLRGNHASATVQGSRGLEEVAEQQVMAVIAAGPGVSKDATFVALLDGTLSSTGTAAVRRTITTTATLEEMAG